MRVLSVVSAVLLAASVLYGAKPMQVYFVDVEGGQATLIVAPSGESMLVDAGWPGRNGRDADRILAAAKKAKIKRIDYMVVTHYHTDHVGGVPQLAEKIPIVTYVDHGPSVESGKEADELVRAYEAYRAKGKHLQVKPGDKIPIKGLDVDVVASGYELIGQPMPGAGAPNPNCGKEALKEEDKTENARSIGMVITLGKFRLADLGDLTWNKEIELMCPNARLAPVDLYLTTHHGMNMSGSAAIVHALRPRVAVMNNGARKGGSPDAWQVIRKSPGLEDLWQLHYAIAGGRENNSPDTFIANTDERCEGQWINLTATPDGAFSLTNARNRYTKTYQPRN
ncbi:MAG TPA: MBL fold metallo-hydrolase [Bryobacteraceae bacterium]|nr:MBL fold metallo-hydrolase [Bryobacteraceae bacterium]